MKSTGRLQYLDWVRGLAAVTMLQGHVFNSFAKNSDRNGGPYLFSQFLGGMPPAIFLFLTGLTLSFLMDGKERKGATPWERWKAALGRSRYLFAIAFLFRIQLWVFTWLFSSTVSPWTDLLRVDILNSMGFALGILSVMAIFTTPQRVRYCALLGLAIAVVAPFVSWINWAAVPFWIRDYIQPSNQFFGFFPWAAFVAFGMSAGSLIRLVDDRKIPQFMQWLALAGITLAFAAHQLSRLSIGTYANADFWLNSPWLILIKLGILLMTLPFAFVWNLNSGWSWIRQLGTTSLLVYWVHIELVYGHWLGDLKENLTVPQTLLASVLVILLMLAISLISTNWKNWRALLTEAGEYWNPVPRRVSGD